MASLRPTEQPISNRVRADIDLAISKLRTLIENTRKLESQAIAFDDPKVDAMQKTVRETIREIFGSDSPEYYDHSQHKIWHGGHIYLEARSKRQEKFVAGIPHTISMLEGLIVRLEDRRNILKDEAPAPASSAKPTAVTATKQPTPIVQNRRSSSVVEATELPRRIMTRRVCIVHGQNDALKNAVVEFLEKQGLEAVILHKQRNSDRNIVEKIESLPEVDYAIVLLSQDDFPQPGKPIKAGKPQRNVLLELGYYIGRLGKSRVCALYKGQGKLPPDYNGIECLSINDSQVWRRLLTLELQDAGFELEDSAEG